MTKITNDDLHTENDTIINPILIGDFFAFLEFKTRVMKRIIGISLFAGGLIAYSCGKEKTRLEKAEWLLGRWENCHKNDCFSETWTKDGADAYEANTFLVSEGDTLFSEYSHLEETGKGLQCVISVQGQNQEKPVTFKMTKQTEDLMVFENPEHDFPQVITYQHKGDSAIAEISGMQKGKFKKERFGMKRVK